MATLVRVERWFRIICTFPLIATASVYLEAMAAAYVLGHWPIPSANDPKNLLTAPFHLISTALVLALYPLLVFVVAIAIKSRRVLRRPSAYWFWLAVLVVGYGAGYLLAEFDPGRIWEWWID